MTFNALETPLALQGKRSTMTKTLGITMLAGGSVSLVLGALGIAGELNAGVNAYFLCLLGIVFFLFGISLLKYSKDADEI